MGYFAIASKRDSDPAPLESRVTIADKDIDRISVAYAQLYFPNGVLVPGTPEVPEIPAVPAVPYQPAIPAQDAIPYQPAVPPTYDDLGNEIDPGQPEVLAQDAVPETPEVLAQDEIPGVPGIPAVPDSVRPPTGQEVFDAVANGLLQGILANTINQEKATAAKDAQDNVPPIPVEPGNA